MQLVLAILSALAALPKIGNLIKDAIAAFMSWRKDQARQAVRRKLEDLTIETKKAKTKEERNEALKKWDDFFSS